MSDNRVTQPRRPAGGRVRRTEHLNAHRSVKEAHTMHPNVFVRPLTSPTTTGENSVNAEPIDVVLTIEEAAKRLRIGRTLMYSLIKNGEIRTVCIGRLRRVPVQALTEYIDNLLNPAA